MLTEMATTVDVFIVGALNVPALTEIEKDMALGAGAVTLSM